MEWPYNGYVISDDKSRLDLETIRGFLAASYWASERPAETIARSIEFSVCYGIYDSDGRQVGFARVVTDWATVYYVADVYIDERHRGQGLGKRLVETIVNKHEGMMGVLGTLDAHGLYERFGFARNADRLMNRRPQTANPR